MRISQPAMPGSGVSRRRRDGATAGGPQPWYNSMQSASGPSRLRDPQLSNSRSSRSRGADSELTDRGDKPSLGTASPPRPADSDPRSWSFATDRHASSGRGAQRWPVSHADSHSSLGSSADRAWMYDLIAAVQAEEERDLRTGRAAVLDGALRSGSRLQPPLRDARGRLFASSHSSFDEPQHPFPEPPEGGSWPLPVDPPEAEMPIDDGSDGDALALLLPLLILLSVLFFVLLLFSVLIVILRRQNRIALTDNDGPADITRDEEDGNPQVAAEREEMYLQGLQQAPQPGSSSISMAGSGSAIAQGYRRAAEYFLAHPPASAATDITLSQFLSIQEKGVSAWSFDPDYESNPSVFVSGRTEITFLADGAGMAPQEGGGVCVQSNLPIPKLNEVYYWEVKMFNKPDTTNIAVGLTTKPYPSFRLPGLHRYSIGFFSADGAKCHNQPWSMQSYGPAYVQGDVIGVGYRPRSGTVFFTRNGKKLEDAFVGLNRHNFFPTIGADGPAEIHVNLGQAGFVFIEANVKKWGLAPMVGTLAPPPPYGHEGGSILIESGQEGGQRSSGEQQRDQQQHAQHSPARTLNPQAYHAFIQAGRHIGTGASQRPGDETPPPPISEEPSPQQSPRARADALPYRQGSARRQDQHAAGRGGAVLLDIPGPSTSSSGAFMQRRASGVSEDGFPHNPPTPNALDISMHNLQVPPQQGRGRSSTLQRHAQPGFLQAALNRLSSPPPYSLDGDAPPADDAAADEASRRTSWLSLIPGFGRGAPADQQAQAEAQRQPSRSRRASISSVHSAALSLTDGDEPHPTASRVPGRTQSFANSVVNILSERGLLTPLSTDTPDLTSPSAAGTEAREPRRDYFGPFRGASTATAIAPRDTEAAYEQLVSTEDSAAADEVDTPRASTDDIEAQTSANTNSNSRSSSAGSTAMAWVSSLLGTSSQQPSA